MVLLLARLARIVFGYVLASLATGFVVYLALLMIPSGGMGQDAKSGGVGFALLISFMVAYFAAFPALVVIALGEYRLWRWWWYYAVAGALIGWALGQMFSPPSWFPWLGLGFGPVAGLIYWGVAGRLAGLAETKLRNILALLAAAGALLLFFSSWASFFGLPF